MFCIIMISVRVMIYVDLIIFNCFVVCLFVIFGCVLCMLCGLYYIVICNCEKSLFLGWVLECVVCLYLDNLVVFDGQWWISYVLFNGWVNCLVCVFKVEGVGYGSVVVVMLENCVELLVIFVVLVKFGVIGVLVNIIQCGKVLVYSLNLVKFGYFVVGEELCEVFEEVCQEVFGNVGYCYWVDDGDIFGDFGLLLMGWCNLMCLVQGQILENFEDIGRVWFKDFCFYIYIFGIIGLLKVLIMSYGKWIKVYGGFGYFGLGLGCDDVFYLILFCYYNNVVIVCWSVVFVGGVVMVLCCKFFVSGFWKDV